MCALVAFKLHLSQVALVLQSLGCYLKHVVRQPIGFHYTSQFILHHRLPLLVHLSPACEAGHKS